ncbi:MAG TPA: hypothetical protein VFF00_06775, partial [Candidatus Elarobacter sp.]|nr:hypothetical protein [Candidatus Elarobacter sp.]
MLSRSPKLSRSLKLSLPLPRPLSRARSLVVAAALLAAGIVFAIAPPARAEDAQRPSSPAPSAVPSASPSPGPTMQWRNIGPAVSGGRVATVAGTDLDPALLYAGAAGGGVWRSTNGGTDWTPVFDKAGTQSIGAIAISPRDKNDVWVGTGEPWPRNDVIPGDGVYHSADGGKTWNQLGLAQTSQIARVLLDPRDPKRVLVAALGDPFKDNPERGVFRSTDGGATWTKTLYFGPAVGASDLAMDPKNPDVLYAGMWRFRRSSWNLTSGGEDDGIYKSADGGATWKRVTGNGLPAGMTGRIALAIAPSDARRIYALIESKEGLLWRSDDGGASWKMTSSNTLIDERPFYYSRVVVDPHDADHLFSVSVLLAESKNGGKSWHVGGRRLHGDHHDLWISANGRTILEGNDGGVALSHDGGATWAWRNTLPIAQFYHVAYDLRTPYHVCGGLQDNGSWCAPARTGDGRGVLPRDWTKVDGGDGTWVVPNPRDPQTIWSSSGGGNNQGSIVRYDRRAQSVDDASPYLRDQNVVAPARLKYRFNWETPLAFDPFDPRALYAGGNVLFRTTDDGMHWTPVSPDLTRNLKARQAVLSGGPMTLDVTGAETFDTLLCVAPSPLARKQIWVSTDDGVVQLTRDGGAHWANVSIPGADADSRVPAVEPSHRAAGTAYAVIDRHYVGDRAPYVYVTTNFGKSWRAIASGLPAAEVHVVREDPRNPSVLYAGTAKGVWWSTDGGGSWRKFPAPMPPVEVRDIAVQPVSGDLIAATHGRGMYVFDDLTALRERAAPSAPARLFPPRDALPLQRYSPTVNERGAPDAPQAAFTFWQQAPAKSAPSFEIADAHGTVVRRIAGTHDEDGEDVPNVPNAAGYNRVEWNLDEDPPTPWRRVAKWQQGFETGVPVLSGTYTVRMRRDGMTYEQKIRVLRDRRVASAADELHGYRLQKAVHAELSRIDDALNGLDNVRVQLPDRIAALKDPALAERARGVLAEAKRIEDGISSQPVNDQDDDFLEDLLRERVFYFNDYLGRGAPTAAQLAEAAALRREGDAALVAYRAFVERQVRPLNDALRAAGQVAVDLNALPPKTKPDPNADEHARRG